MTTPCVIITAKYHNYSSFEIHTLGLLVSEYLEKVGLNDVDVAVAETKVQRNIPSVEMIPIPEKTDRES